MKAYAALPEGYRKLREIDLNHNMKEALIVNGLALAISIVMLVLGFIFQPLVTRGANGSLELPLLPLIVAIVGSFVYIILHEATHGVTMYAISGVKPSFGFKGLYAYAGSTCYFEKPGYIVTALAPLVVWTVLLTVPCVILRGTPWFWAPYFIQIMNISGSSGDIYVSIVVGAMKGDLLINDTGTEMAVYSR